MQNRLLFLTFTLLLACGKNEADKTAAEDSLRTSYFTVNDGLCQVVKPTAPYSSTQLASLNAEAASSGRMPFAKGTCPESAEVGGQTATLVKTCSTYKKSDDPNIYQITIYSRIKSGSDYINILNTTQAEAICQEIAKS